MDNLPLGAKYDKNAPWNQEDNPEKEIEADIVITLTKRVKLKVNDYIISDEGVDEDGHYIDLDFANCDIYRAAQDQLDLNFGDWTITEFDAFKI